MQPVGRVDGPLEDASGRDDDDDGVREEEEEEHDEGARPDGVESGDVEEDQQRDEAGLHRRFGVKGEIGAGGCLDI